nr:unnamed protein product [Haemonchus contortus]
MRTRKRVYFALEEEQILMDMVLTLDTDLTDIDGTDMDHTMGMVPTLDTDRMDIDDMDMDPMATTDKASALRSSLEAIATVFQLLQ